MDPAESPESLVREKLCLVCGDKALGYNFNAITCESCKAFFRRNALKDKEFKCPFNKNCEITIITRRFCQLCRLIKCFEIGMKKEYIMSEDDKREKRKKIEQKRAERVGYAEESLEMTEPSEDENVAKRTKTFETSVEVVPNPLSLAVTCSNPYKKLVPFNSNAELQGNSNDGHSVSSLPISSSGVDNAPLPSPSMAEPSSPVGASLADSRGGGKYNSNRSRSVEIYQMSKVSEPARPSYEPVKIITSPPQPRASDSSIIKNILSGDHHFEALPKNKNVEKYDGPSSISSEQMPLLASLVGGSSELPRHDRAFRSDVADEVLRDVPSRSSQLDLGNSIESILSEAIKLEYEAYSSMNPRINSRELNDAERAKLNELIVANKALLAPLEDDATSLMAQEAMSKSNLGVRPILVDVLNLTAVAIRRLIKMSKKVNAFKNMCQEDQVALLKGGCTEMMILRSAMTYDSDRGSWKIPHSAEMNIKVDVLKEAGGRVFEEHQRFLQTFDPRWRNDENIMLILSAITLFTPDRPRVVHYDVIKLEQNSYYYLLRRYLESIYPGCESRSTFLKLIHKMGELHRLNEDHVRVYMELNPEDVEPLLIEIFDLNPH